MILSPYRQYILREPDGLPKAVPSSSTGKVALPVAPTPAELEVEFKMDDDILKDESPAPESSKKEEVKPEPEKKLVEKEVKFTAKVEAPVKKEEKKVEPAPKVEVKPKIPQLITPLAAKVEQHLPEKRDYTGFNADEVKVLEKMSNDAFSYTTNLIKERRELEKLKGQQFVQHPEAYVLDPDYKKLNEDVNFLQKEADYWQTQLIKAVEGNEWSPITGWDKQGNPIIGAPQKATALATEQLRMAVSNCLNGANNGKQQLQQFTQGYQQRIQADVQNTQQMCAQYFGWVADPKQLDMTVNTGEKDETVKEIRERFLSIIPPYQRNTLGFDVAAHMFAALQIYGQRIRELENGKHIAEVKAEEVLLAEPNGNRSGEQGKEVNGITEFSMEGLPL